MSTSHTGTFRRTSRSLTFLQVLACLIGIVAMVTTSYAQNTVIPGGHWKDTSGNVMKAHGAGMLQVGSTYYMFGEADQDSGTYAGVNCYSSSDLINWNFVADVLPPQASGDLAAGQWVERPKVLYNKQYNNYVMWLHVSPSTGSAVGYATSPTPCGQYTYIGSSQPMGNSSFDIGSFQDDDGTAYLLSANYYHGIIVYQMAPDYLSPVAITDPNTTWGDREAPAMVKLNGIYYLICSHETGFAANDDQYSTAPSISGPWTPLADIATPNTNTYTSQSSWIQTINGTAGTSVIYMGDRWISGDISNSSYIWLPLNISGTNVSMPWVNQWTLNLAAGTWVDTSLKTLQTGSFTQLVNFSSGLCYSSINTTSGTTVAQAFCDPSDNLQQLQLTDAGNGAYYLQSQATGYVADVAGGSTSSGAKIISYPSHYSSNEQWKFNSTGSGNYTLTNVRSGLCLTVTGTGANALKNGATLAQATCNGNTAQQWYQRVPPAPSIGTNSLVISAQRATVTAGTASTTLTATAQVGNGLSPSNPFAFQVNGGTPQAGTCSLSGSLYTCTLSYPTGSPATGRYPVNVSFPGDEYYAPASATTSLTVNPASGTVQLITTTSLAQMSDGSYKVSVTVQNAGTTSATGVSVNSFTLGSTSALGLPLSMGTVAAGASVTATLTVPASSGSSSNTVAEQYSGTYSGGTFSGSQSVNTTTAWSNGSFQVNTADVVSQSNIILNSPNSLAYQAMPLGNGNTGTAVWAANGMTIQVNRNDTFPNRKSLGWVLIPGLSPMVAGADYSGKLDLYNGQLTESGAGMSATAFVRHDKDETVVYVTGADPNSMQTAQIQLWNGRSPIANVSGPVGTLAETFSDNTTAELNSGNVYGSLLGITAGGRNVIASVVNPTTVQVSFQPNSDGTFTIVIASPTYNGSQDPMGTVQAVLGNDATANASTLQTATTSWWNNYWASTALIQMNSTDGSAAYVENMRDIDLFLQAASQSGSLPGHHAGMADLFTFSQDSYDWDPELFWHWNLRMFTGSNLAAGHPEFNAPYFNLYTSNLSNIEAWTKSQFPVGTGNNACVPEMTRFNGNGSGSNGDESCWPAASPKWDALTLSTGPEVAVWIWEQYLYTGDSGFLFTNYPLMAASARFQLAYAQKGSDGKLHMSPTNAHEDQWGISDSSMNDVAGMIASFNATISAAQTLNTDADLVTQLQTALTQLPNYPRVDIATKSHLQAPSADAAGNDMLANSYVPTATIHNNENDNLEPVWPFGLIGNNSSRTALALRTYQNRRSKNMADWSFDAVQAARLGDASDFASAVVSLIKSYQVYPNGTGTVFGNGRRTFNFYDELNGGVANSVQEALVQDYDGVLRIAPAWPTASWSVSGTAYIQGKSKVDVQVENGVLITAVLEAGSTQNYPTLNPWSGQSVTVVDASTGSAVVAPTTASQFVIPAQAGHAYIIEPVSNSTTSLPFAIVDATPASAPRNLSNVTLGTN